MCGIAGAFGRVSLSEDRIVATLEALNRRGPDAEGRHVGTMRGFPLVLLHRRLAIVDLDGRSDQPYCDENCVLVANAEIYNYLELRRDLETMGHRFRTESDTEVIVKAYRAWGTGCVDRFEGMWAFALFDRQAETLVLSRDRFGEKPLYYTFAERTLYFASEIKAIATMTGCPLSVNRSQIRRYLVNGYKSIYKTEDTYFAGIRELPAATLAVVRKPGEVRPEAYWRLSYRPSEMSLDDAVEGVRERLLHSVELRLRADVPVAFCLSGGVDSGALAAIAAKRLGRTVHAFSIVDRDPRYDESDNIEITARALHCALHVIPTSQDGFLDRLARLIDHRDAPVATISYYVHAQIAEILHRHGFKVAISGTGADELFTGYYDHYAFWLAEMRHRPDFDDLLDDWHRGYGIHVRNPLLRDPLAIVRDPTRRDHIFLDREIFNRLLKEPISEGFYEVAYADSVLRNRMLNELGHESVPVMLHEDDRNSMCWSVENRSPYLDRQLAEFAYSVPNRHLIRDGHAKWLLRAAVDGLLPDTVRLDKRKRGFNASIASLVDLTDATTRERLLAPGPIFDLVDRDGLTKFFDSDMSPNSHSKFLFSFISARLFLESPLASGAVGVKRAA